jgi:hypothetical protein
MSQAELTVQERIKGVSLFKGMLPIFLTLLPALLFPAVILLLYARSHLPEEEFSTLFLIGSMSITLGAIGSWYVLGRWWQEVEGKVLQEIKDEESGETYASIVESRDQLAQQLAAAQLGYEHQIDLLQSSAAKSKQEVLELNIEMDQKLEEIRHAYLEFEDLRKEYARLDEEFRLYQTEELKKEQHQEVVIKDYQKTIQEQRTILKKKQSYIEQLEEKVKELRYEIRSLLQIGESTSSSLSSMEISDPKEMTAYYLGKGNQNYFDIESQLDHYVEVAESFTGAEHLGYLTGTGPRFLDGTQSYTIDLRRLFDCYREETGIVLIVLSLIEKKILFTNPYVKSVLGWGSERFSQEFPQLLSVEGNKLWDEALKTVIEKGGVKTAFNLSHKDGRELSMTCGIKKIGKGPFQNQAVGVLFTQR